MTQEEFDNLKKDDVVYLYYPSRREVGIRVVQRRSGNILICSDEIGRRKEGGKHTYSLTPILAILRMLVDI